MPNRARACGNSVWSSQRRQRPREPYVEAFEVGSLLFLSGMLPVENGKFVQLFGTESGHVRTVYGVQSLPIGTPVMVEVIFEIK